MADDDVDDVQLAYRHIATLNLEIMKLAARCAALEERNAELEAGVVRVSTYLGVMHVLKEKSIP